jgi:hypothetical protein
MLAAPFAGTGGVGFLDGPGTAAMFRGPCGVAVDGEGNIILAESGNDRVRKIDASLVPPSAVAASKGPMAPLAADLLRMLSSEKYADVTFSVDGQLIGAHRNILCARSEYFATMLGSPFREGESAHGDRSASDEREGASPQRKRRATGIAEEDGGRRTGTRVDGTADRLLRVEDATAPAFRAVLRFLYSNEPLFEQDTLIDQMRCAHPVPRCCRVRACALPAVLDWPATVYLCGSLRVESLRGQVGTSVSNPEPIRCVQARVRATRSRADGVRVADAQRAVLPRGPARGAAGVHCAQLEEDLPAPHTHGGGAQGVSRDPPSHLARIGSRA